jgi:hypothetical protein
MAGGGGQAVEAVVSLRLTCDHPTKGRKADERALELDKAETTWRE